MALSVKNEEADRLARELSALTGESITEAVVVALRERLQRMRASPSTADRLHRLVADLADYPVRDARPADDILGYDTSGLPT
ncbi:MAG TPA: type II toxin-antitoxin system VapB family antitoxin [Acidimicrobiia bacterium]|jgi:antitoxin VapB